MPLPDGTTARILPPIGRAISAGAMPPLLPRMAPPIARGRANHLMAAAAQIGRIRGTVLRQNDQANTPVRRRVRLYRWRDGLLVGQQWSDAATGAYDFQWVEINQVYTVIADDYTGNWRAVIADQLQPEPMPS